MTSTDDIIGVRRALQRMAGERGWVNGARLVQRLADALSIQHLAVKQALKTLARDSIINNIAPTGDAVGRVTVLQPLLDQTPELAAHEVVWREVVAGLALPTEQGDALVELAPILAELDRDDMESLAKGIVSLAHSKGLEAKDPYEVSAKHLLGSSKILAQIEGALAPLGISPDRFGSRPRYVLAAGPERPESVLLVENAEVFDRVIRLGLTDRLTVVATFGYGLSWTGIAAEGRLENFRVARVEGSPPGTFAEVVDGLPCHFWGDLDQAGLGIFLSLRSLIPHLRLSSLYSPMLAGLQRRGANHPYCALADKAGQMPLSAADPAVRMLAEACIKRAVDQELVSDDDIVRLAHLPFSM